MKFITLKLQGEGTIKVNPMAIIALEPSTNMTKVYAINGDAWIIVEPIEQIEKKIADAEKITLTTWETGPR
jgi:uncharacterized protein YlzI (FlbEa/FlbD family)